MAKWQHQEQAQFQGNRWIHVTVVTEGTSDPNWHHHAGHAAHWDWHGHLADRGHWMMSHHVRSRGSSSGISGRRRHLRVSLASSLEDKQWALELEQGMNCSALAEGTIRVWTGSVLIGSDLIGSMILTGSDTLIGSDWFGNFTGSALAGSGSSPHPSSSSLAVTLETLTGLAGSDTLTAGSGCLTGSRTGSRTVTHSFRFIAPAIVF